MQSASFAQDFDSMADIAQDIAPGSPLVSNAAVAGSGEGPLPISEDTETRDFAVAMATIANDTRGSDISVLHVEPLIYWTRYMVCRMLSSTNKAVFVDIQLASIAVNITDIWGD